MRFITALTKKADLISRPVILQMPFLIIFMVIMNVETLQNIHGKLATGDTSYPFSDLLGRLCIVYLYGFILSCIITKINKTWFKVLIYTICVSLFAIEECVTLLFDMRISPQLLTLITETNFEEATEFATTFLTTPKALVLYVSLAVFVCFIIITEHLYNKYACNFRELSLLKYISSCLSTIIIFFGLLSSLTFVGLFKSSTLNQIAEWRTYTFCKPRDPISDTMYAFWGGHIGKKEIEKSLSVTLNLEDTPIITKDDSLNIIFVVGESYIKSHAGIYGYPLPTTPNMVNEQKEGRLFAFTDAITPWAVTSYVLRNIFCTNSIVDGEEWFDTPLFPAIFKKAGYDIYMYDNQYNPYTNVGWELAISNFLFNRKIRNATYTKHNKGPYKYDHQLVDAYMKEVTLKNKNNLVIFHLIGQHGNPLEHFPNNKEFNVFKAEDVPNKKAFVSKRKAQYIADYDNATLYNDSLMKKIFNLYKDQQTVVVYISDHGEERYDFRDNAGRVHSNVTKELAHAHYDVPMFIWMSQKYMEANPETVRKVSSSVGRSIMTDNICNMLFSIGNIQTKYYRPERDFIGPDFKQSKRLIRGTIDYDLVK